LKLTELIGDGSGFSGPVPSHDPDIRGLTADSRAVEPGFLFAALVGAHFDGRCFAGDAVARGAVAILTDDVSALKLASAMRAGVLVIADPNPRRKLAQLAAKFYGLQPRIVAAVTGTNGKTSVVHFTREIWAAAGHHAASLGTLGVVTGCDRRGGALTTPDPVALHRDLAGLAKSGITHLAIEASSHGLAQFRLDGLVVAAAAFTNLSRDHLDYHRDMSQYRAAKQRLFRELLAPGGTAVVNRDSAEFGELARLCRDRGHPVLGYGAAAEAELRLVGVHPVPRGQDIEIELFGERHALLLPLLGRFQALNALAALGLALATGVPAAKAVPALSLLTGVPGRMQFVAGGETGGGIVVDYAHTPDALATVLEALRPHAPGRLAVVFGAGGDRDPGKRPLMGRVAATLADRVYVTDDNPRSEDPAAIRRAILSGAPAAVEIGDRRRAIATAIAELRPGDLLVIAGKGHETGQIVGGETIPFDDAVVAREILAEPANPAPRRAP
jgi:UDP-N-acetylmuramoyl-L-alanyl-D-glutamate--2,6-diaminopimelate ligase